MPFHLIDVYRNSMPPHPKKLKRNGPSANAAAATANGIAALEAPNTNAGDRITDGHLLDGIEYNPTMSGISNKLTSTILGFLGYKDIMRSRICCKKFRDAARTTIVPWVNYCHNKSYSRSKESQVRVDSEKKYKAMVAMTTALPNLQQLEICKFETGHNHKYCDGEDPSKWQAAATANLSTHDIQLISKFRHLRRLTLSIGVTMNGRYPALFNFPLLQTLEIVNCCCLKWDLEMLAGLPSLKILSHRSPFGSPGFLTGNIRSLRTLKNTLRKVRLGNSKIEGDFMDLADFPRLKSLDLDGCSLISGDMREIGESDFASLKFLDLGRGKLVIGGKQHVFQRISDVPSVAKAIYRLKQRDPPLVKSFDDIYWELSSDSPEHYAHNCERGHPRPPFYIRFVQAGSRVGWRWYAYSPCTNSCEINWLDPEPDRESSDYEVYDRELQSIEDEIFCFEGYYQPPSEDDYKRLCKEFYGI